MTAVAWAIIFLASVISDGVYTTKYGTSYPTADIIGFFAGVSFVLCLICTVAELRRRDPVSEGKQP